jgi:hypothetical protein
LSFNGVSGAGRPCPPRNLQNQERLKFNVKYYFDIFLNKKYFKT